MTPVRPVRRRSLRGALVAALLLLCGLLAACGTSTVTPLPPGSSGDEKQRAATGDTSHLLGARRDAGIADCPASDPQVAAREDGLPDLTLPCLGGDSQVRLAGLRGKPTVINVWAQWCGPCRQEAPILAELQNTAGDKVNLIGIDFVDPRPELAIEFAKESGWRYPQLVDADKQIAPGLKVVGPPQTILVDADGKVVHIHPGPFTSTEQAKQLISEKLGVKW